MCKCLLLHPLAIVLLVFHPLQVAQADGAAIDQPVKAEDKSKSCLASKSLALATTKVAVHQDQTD